MPPKHKLNHNLNCARLHPASGIRVGELGIHSMFIVLKAESRDKVYVAIQNVILKYSVRVCLRVCPHNFSAFYLTWPFSKK